MQSKAGRLRLGREYLDRVSDLSPDPDKRGMFPSAGAASQVMLNRSIASHAVPKRTPQWLAPTLS